MTQNVIETLKTSIYSPKHTQNTFQNFILFKKEENKPYFEKKQVKTKSAFYANLYTLLIWRRAGYVQQQY